MMSIWLALACTPEVKDTAEPVNLAPQIEWTAPTDRLIEGQDVSISVTITDEDGIQEGIVYHRPMGSSLGTDILEDAGEDIWTATLPSLSLPGVEFYLRRKIRGLRLQRHYSHPMVHRKLSLSVYPESRPLPFDESFELLEGQLHCWISTGGRRQRHETHFSGC